MPILSSYPYSLIPILLSLSYPSILYPNSFPLILILLSLLILIFLSLILILLSLSYSYPNVLFCLVFLSFGAGPMGIWPLPSAVPQGARHVFYGHFCIKALNAPVFEPFLHQGRRKYAYLWDFVQAGFPMPPVLSYFVRQDNRKYAYLWDFVEAGLRMPPVLWDFLHQGSRKYAYLCSFPA